MPVKHARHIALSAALAAWVDEQIVTGEFTSASDLVWTALRQMPERQATDDLNAEQTFGAGAA